MKNKFTIALAGNPNVGKTTVFNLLTGSHQTVGNWAGVTVEHKEGVYQFDNCEVKVIDLPGIYSLTATTTDEKVSRTYLINNTPDLIVNVVDAANLERNLYLTMQLLELQIPIVIVLTMLDIAEKNEVNIEVEHLQKHLDCVVYLFKLFHRATEQELKNTLNLILQKREISKQIVRYDGYTETAIEKLKTRLNLAEEVNNMPLRWFIIKLLEDDEEYERLLSHEAKTILFQQKQAIERHRGVPCKYTIVEDRYAYIHGLIVDVLKRKDKWRQTFSDRIDKVVLNSWLGIPIFLIVMAIVFSLTIKASQPFVDWIGQLFSWIFVKMIAGILYKASIPNWLIDFITKGIGEGIVTVLSFVPPIFFIYVSLSWLEDSGYLSRAAFVADKIMRRIGLPGKAFIPLLVGFGCTVPAILATRTLDNKRDRLLASLLTPLMSCGAKLPVYTYLCMIFFPHAANWVVFSLYLIGIIVALLIGLLLNKTIFTKDVTELVMELPAYHLPTFNGVFMHTWYRLKDFVLRAGKTILIVITVMYIVQMIKIPVKTYKIESNRVDVLKVSLMEKTGQIIAPVFEPMGIKKDNWQAVVALLSGLFAKEAIVGSLQSLYVTENKAKYSEIIKQKFGNQRAVFSYLLFILFYSPCLAALTVLGKEFGKLWVGFTFLFLTFLAWCIAVVYYQIMVFSEAPLLSITYLFLVIVGLVLSYFILKWFGNNRKHEILS